MVNSIASHFLIFFSALNRHRAKISQSCLIHSVIQRIRALRSSSSVNDKPYLTASQHQSRMSLKTMATIIPSD